MPEVALLGAGLGEQLAADSVDGLAVLLVPVDIIQNEQVLALIHVVQIILLGVVGLDGAILLNKVINEALGEVQILLVAGGLVQA